MIHDICFHSGNLQSITASTFYRSFIVLLRLQKPCCRQQSNMEVVIQFITGPRGFIDKNRGQNRENYFHIQNPSERSYLLSLYRNGSIYTGLVSNF